MTTTAAIVFGVLPKHNQLPGQVFACLDQGVKLLQAGAVQVIAVIGGYGHGHKDQSQPEAAMMQAYLQSKGVAEEYIIANDKPVTTPEALWEVRSLPVQFGRILTITHKQERIAFLAGKIVGPLVPLSVEVVPYSLTPGEHDTSGSEQYFLAEARRELQDMKPGDGHAFERIYSFKHHVWVRFAQKQGRL